MVKLSLGEDVPQDRAYWNWKHHSNPFGISPVLLAEADGELTGLRVFMRWQWHAGKQKWSAVRAVDTATHPEWQRKGIFSKLTLQLVEEMRAEGVAFVFNTPNAQSRPGYLKMGWSTVGRTDLWISPVHPLKLARVLFTRQLRIAKDLNINPAAAGAFGTARDFCGTSEFAKLAYDAEQRSDDAALHTPRTAQYLRWRYSEIPTFQYYVLHDSDDRGGAAIFFRYKLNGPLVEARVCDTLIGTGDSSQKIMRHLLGRLRAESSADYLSIMPAAPRLPSTTLLSAGFLPAPRLGPILTVRPLHAEELSSDPLQRSSWRLAIGDLELF